LQLVPLGSLAIKSPADGGPKEILEEGEKTSGMEGGPTGKVLVLV